MPASPDIHRQPVDRFTGGRIESRVSRATRQHVAKRHGPDESVEENVCLLKMAAKRSADSGGVDRELTRDREMLAAVGERTAGQRLERGLIVGEGTTLSFF
jgi:hypothetical protein